MQRAHTIAELRRARADLSGRVAFVPTMGFLHPGHLALMRRGLECADHLVVSVFVNPTQFGPDEDLESYPRDIKGDAQKCRNLGCDILFTPRRDEIYLSDHTTEVRVGQLDRYLCGARRPGHFPGVTTVVCKLFNIVRPDVAVFGRKDYQQLAIVRRMVRDLDFPIAVEGVPIVREEDGLAMSSRNRYLDGDQRHQATSLSRGLVAAHRTYRNEPKSTCRQIVNAARQPIEDASQAEIDYVECVHPDTLVPYADDESVGDQGAVVAMAVVVGSARLIDNLRIDEPLPEGPLRSLS